MDCRTFRGRLEDYLEGGLDFPGRFGMERHAQQCFSCGKIVADAQELSRKVRECKRVAAPPGFETAVMKRIQDAAAERRFRHPFLSWRWDFGRASWRLLAAGASSIALLGLGIFFTLRFAPRARPAPESPVVAAPARPAPALADRNANPQRRADLSRQKSLEAMMRNVPDLPIESVESSDSDYVELLIPDAGGRMRVVRLPGTIRMRYGQPSEQYFIRNVSH